MCRRGQGPSRRDGLTSGESEEGGDLLVDERLTDLNEHDHVRVTHQQESCSIQRWVSV